MDSWETEVIRFWNSNTAKEQESPVDDCYSCIVKPDGQKRKILEMG